MSRAVEDSGTELVLVWPTGDEGERAWRDALHACGSARTAREGYQYRKLVKKHGDPDLTIEKYGEYLKLHARNDERTVEETARYRETGDRFGLHGRPELRWFRSRLIRSSARLSCRPLRSGRAPRSRRVRTARTSRGSSSQEPHEPEPPLLARSGGRVRLDRGRAV